ncbi:ArnT family glycosyltransferase [Verrucomicrobiota bacterium]
MTKVRETTQTEYRICFWLLLIGATLFRLFIAGRIGLSTDESHYLMYARYPAWGYFDHPPMVAFLAGLTTWFGKLGESPFFLRLGPVICWFLSIVLLRALTLVLYKDEKIAFWASILLLLMPVHHLLAIALLPDSTLNLFWCGTLVVSWLAMRDGKWSMWILAGLLLGGALLSKYHGVLLPLCLFGYVLSSRQHRHWLASPKPYVAALAGFLVFLPNIIWNYRNDWISYGYQLGHGGGGGYFSIGKFFESIGGQLAAASPILFVLLVLSFVFLARTKQLSEEDRFVLWTSAPVFVFFCGIGLFGKVLPHWPAAGWWTGTLALTVTVLRKTTVVGKTGTRWRRWIIAGAVLGFLSVVFIYAAIACPVIRILYNGTRKVSLELHEKLQAVPVMKPFRSKYDITNDMYGWDVAGRVTERIRHSMPRPETTFVFCHRFFTVSQLTPYLDSETKTTSLNRRPSQYRLWFKAPEYKGWDALFADVERWKKGCDRYLPLFERVDPEPIIIEVLRDGQAAHKFYVYKYYGFKGKYEERRKKF